MNWQNTHAVICVKKKSCNCSNCRKFKLLLEKCVEEDIENINLDSDLRDADSDDTALYYESDFLESAESDTELIKYTQTLELCNIIIKL